MTTAIISFSAELAQQLMESADGFPVDFDLAWVWAGYSRKERALSKLKKHFIEGLDFSTNYCKTPSGGRPSVSVQVSVECFKHFCMMAGTDKGREVRGYFLECERLAQSAQPKSDALSLIEVMQNSLQLLSQHESRLALVEQQNALLIEQNQYLSQQVVLLQSSQEALELETDANAAELDRYRNGHGRYYTVAAWCNLHGYALSLQAMNTQGRKISAICRIQNIVPQPVSDPRWGTVQSYPDAILMEMNWD